MVFARAKSAVTRLITKYGQDCTWQQIVPTSGGTAAKPAGTAVAGYPCKIVFLNHKRESLATAISMLVGTDIPTGGLVGLMIPAGFTPTLKDIVIRQPYVEDAELTGEQYGIADNNGIEILAPNNEGPILYRIRLVR